MGYGRVEVELLQVFPLPVLAVEALEFIWYIAVIPGGGFLGNVPVLQVGSDKPEVTLAGVAVTPSPRQNKRKFLVAAEMYLG